MPLDDIDIAIGVIDDLSTLFSDRNTIRCHVILAIGDGDDQTFPARFDILRHTVQTVANLAQRVVVPAHAFAGNIINYIEWRVGILHRHRDRTPVEIGQMPVRQNGSKWQRHQ